MSLYTELVAAGVPVDHHYSDLYAKVTPEAKAILERERPYRLTRIETFRSTIDHDLWYDIPFAYDPFWEHVSTGCKCGGQDTRCCRSV